ncbi:MAG: DUF362 domain-containing protein [Bacteroidales bacterium]|nr:DUF362 domain-containing protein [Bacteroidales bacterium]
MEQIIHKGGGNVFVNNKMSMFNNKIALRNCKEYDFNKIYSHIRDIFKICDGPEVQGKRVLLKPNILSDSPPEKCVTTHPVVIEALIRFLQDNGATAVYIGDSPAIHIGRFRPAKSGIMEVCKKTGTEWISFTTKSSELKLNRGSIKVTSCINDVDLIISVPKLKNHELVYFTGAIKNTLGLVPGFNKTKQHALYQDRNSFSQFLVDLSEAVTPDFFIMDGIMGMEGAGPAQGSPYSTGVLIGSSNPLALDIIASSVAGYDPAVIPTNRIALARGKWLKGIDDIIYDGPALSSVIKKDFRRIPITGFANISVRFLSNRIIMLRKLERRPVFLKNKCTGCGECVKICPENAIDFHPADKKHIVLTDRKCIRCYCCSEVCRFNAIKVRIKPFGV